jgi:hypothetical protein
VAQLISVAAPAGTAEAEEVHDGVFETVLVGLVRLLTEHPHKLVDQFRGEGLPSLFRLSSHDLCPISVD